MPLPLKHFYMLRHGETEANARQIMAGSMDSPLTKTGQDQARKMHDVFDFLEVKPKAIIHSHLSRARDTAHILNEKLDLKVHEHDGLSEMHVGDLEGASYEDCNDVFLHGADPPNGEAHVTFQNRIKTALSDVLKVHDAPSLIVAHGGVLAAFGKLYGLRVNYFFRNCHLYEFEPDENNRKFPWRIWQYDEDEVVIKKPAEFFHAAMDEISS